MHCAYHVDDRCRSCTLLTMPYAEQLVAKQRRAEEILGLDCDWLAPVRSPEQGFRNKAKMVVGGSLAQPTIGIRDAEGHGIDLRECPVCPEELHRAFAVLAEFVTHAHLVPYRLADRRGELKHLIVTVSADGELMIRFVLRSTESIPRIRKHLQLLTGVLPVAVISANILPQHAAILEGDQEILLTERQMLPMTFGAVTVHLPPGAFFQTNTVVAGALYQQVQMWVSQAQPASMWDLYCGAGGFALHCAAPGRHVTGVEINRPAIAGARLSAAQLGFPGLTFHAADAIAFAHAHRAPDAVIVNPPRRGIGVELADWLNTSAASQLLYSSCHPVSLRADFDRMPNWRITKARLFDMFAHTPHCEIVVSAERV